MRVTVKSLAVEVGTRLVLLGICLALEFAPPIHRQIMAEEAWLYRFPHSTDTVTTPMLLVIIICVPSAFFIVQLFGTRDKLDFIQSVLGVSLSSLLTCLTINVIKICVGRPRPDFISRCFPNGETALFTSHCTGDWDTVQQGLKSFPSGHTGFVFASFGFLSLYFAGKLQCFVPAGRGKAWRLCVVITPLLAAAVLGISRMKDHRHHYEDVLVGGLIGFSMAVLCYLQHYPSPLHPGCEWPRPLEPAERDRASTSPSHSILPQSSSRPSLHPA